MAACDLIPRVKLLDLKTKRLRGVIFLFPGNYFRIVVKRYLTFAALQAPLKGTCAVGKDYDQFVQNVESDRGSVLCECLFQKILEQKNLPSELSDWLVSWLLGCLVEV